MPDEPANLVLEFRRAIRGDIAEMSNTLRDQGHCLGRIEGAVAAPPRDHARERVARIEARLDIQNA